MQPTLHIYIWSLLQVLIFIKFLSNTFLQKSGGKDKSTELSARATNLWRNDLENIVPFSFLALAGAIVQVNLSAYIILMVLFCFGRIAHAIFMMKGVLIGRGAGYALGMGCMATLSVLIVIRLIPIFSTF